MHSSSLPFLKIGTTCASFQASGKTDVFIEKLKILVSEGAIVFPVFLISSDDIGSGPHDFVVFMIEIMSFTVETFMSTVLRVPV